MNLFAIISLSAVASILLLGAGSLFSRGPVIDLRRRRSRGSSHDRRTDDRIVA